MPFTRPLPPTYRRPRGDSNAQPTDSKSGTLSIELRGQAQQLYREIFYGVQFYALLPAWYDLTASADEFIMRGSRLFIVVTKDFDGHVFSQFSVDP